MLNDRQFLNTLHGRFINQTSISNSFLPSSLLSQFSQISLQIRNAHNFPSDGYYDDILNECLLDAVNEVISTERHYSNCGAPLPWSLRTRLNFTYTNDEASKRKLQSKVNHKLTHFLSLKLGDDAIDTEQLSQGREKKFITSIKEELDDEDWKVFETEETLIQLIMSKIIMGQLFTEVVEILEHIRLSRKEPHRYQNKSIYACEDIPHLTIQSTTNTNEENDSINQ